MDLKQKDYLITNGLNFETFPADLTQDSFIKREEELKDEEDLLLFAQLDSLSKSMDSSSEEFQIIQEVEVRDQLKDPVLDNMSIMEMDKIPVHLRFSNDDSTSHFIRYKLQDGKHVKIWECGICGKDFTHQYTLMRHLPTHTDERKFQCNTCGKAFRQMSTLSQHRAIHSTERPYICEICNKTFNRVSTLISHRKTHTGDKPHRCHLCNKSFHQKGNLRNHIFTHTNERPYKCDICEKGFNQMSNLMCHKFKAHHRTEKPKYSCQVCGKCFPKRVGLRHHEQYTHGMINPPAGNMPEVADNNSILEAILVDPIKTEAMRLALEANQTPFALLRPVCGIPVLVRVLPAGDKQMLVPATADDLKKHAHISITPKTEPPIDGTSGNTVAAVGDCMENKENNNGKNGKNVGGSTVQLKIPVVATVIQQRGLGGQLSMSVRSPGPNEYQSDVDAVGNRGSSYIPTISSNTVGPGGMVDIGDMTFTETFPMKNVNFEYMDETGKIVEEEEFRRSMPTATSSRNENFIFNMSENLVDSSMEIKQDEIIIDDIHIFEKRPLSAISEQEIKKDASY